MRSVDKMIVKRLGDAPDNTPLPPGQTRSSQYLDPFGVIYYRFDDLVGGRFSNGTHIPGEGNSWQP